jgi:hypothetical protein
MKIQILALVLSSIVLTPAFGRRGGGGGGGDDSDRQITCADAQSNQVLFTVSSVQQNAKFENEKFSFELTARGDDIGHAILKDLTSGDMLDANRQEEILTTVLTTDEDSLNPITRISGTRRGLATFNYTAASGDTALVDSLSRRGEQSMYLKLSTDEGSNLEVLCLRN